MSDPTTVFLLDVDNTLLDNDAITQDLREHLSGECGADAAERYWALLREVSDERGYRDYLGALQRYRVEHPHNPRLLSMSSWLVDYPFAERLYPRALEVVEHLARWGQVVIVSDGDAVFQPRKVERSGIAAAVGGAVLIYIHKEQETADIERLYPADHYVMVDDKVRLLDALKQAWGPRVTTVFVRQGHYAHDPDELAAHPPADLQVDRIGDLLEVPLTALSGAPEAVPSAAHARDGGPS